MRPLTIIIKIFTNNFFSAYVIENNCTKQLEYSSIQDDIPFKIACAVLILKVNYSLYDDFMSS